LALLKEAAASPLGVASDGRTFAIAGVQDFRDVASGLSMMLTGRTNYATRYHNTRLHYAGERRIIGHSYGARVASDFQDTFPEGAGAVTVIGYAPADFPNAKGKYTEVVKSRYDPIASFSPSSGSVVLPGSAHSLSGMEKAIRQPVTVYRDEL